MSRDHTSRFLRGKPENFPTAPLVRTAPAWNTVDKGMHFNCLAGIFLREGFVVGHSQLFPIVFQVIGSHVQVKHHLFMKINVVRFKGFIRLNQNCNVLKDFCAIGVAVNAH